MRPRAEESGDGSANGAAEGPAPFGFRRSFSIALADAGLGDKDRAFEFLDKACEERDSLLAVLRADPLVDPLHSDARWGALLRKIGVVPEAMLATLR